MTFRTGRGAQGLRMAIAARGAAMVNAAPALIGNPRVRTVICCGPVICGMAGGAIRAKHACMKDRISMAACAGRR